METGRTDRRRARAEPSQQAPSTTARRHQTCDFRAHATSAPAELGGEIHNVSHNRACTQVLLQARKLHVYGSGTFGAFWGKQGVPMPAAGPPAPTAQCSPCGRGLGSDGRPAVKPVFSL